MIKAERERFVSPTFLLERGAWCKEIRVAAYTSHKCIAWREECMAYLW